MCTYTFGGDRISTDIASDKMRGGDALAQVLGAFSSVFGIVKMCRDPTDND